MSRFQRQSRRHEDDEMNYNENVYVTEETMSDSSIQMKVNRIMELNMKIGILENKLQ